MQLGTGGPSTLSSWRWNPGEHNPPRMCFVLTLNHAPPEALSGARAPGAVLISSTRGPCGLRVSEVLGVEAQASRPGQQQTQQLNLTPAGEGAGMGQRGTAPWGTAPAGGVLQWGWLPRASLTVLSAACVRLLPLLVYLRERLLGVEAPFAGSLQLYCSKGAGGATLGDAQGLPPCSVLHIHPWWS